MPNTRSFVSVIGVLSVLTKWRHVAQGAQIINGRAPFSRQQLMKAPSSQISWMK
jgi:hypothetical protein